MTPATSADELSARGCEAAEALLLRLADDEFVLGERYVEWQVAAPTLESDLALANIAQDELGHARVWYDVLEEEFGRTEAALLYRREPAAFRHATLVELPFARGDWADVVVRSYLYDAAEERRLAALAGSSYARIADPVAKLRREETYHREHARRWLERLCEASAGRDRVQAAVDRLFPHALTLFAPGEREAAIVDCGLRTRTLPALRREWLDAVIPFLESLGVATPIDPDGDADELLPDRRGRDGRHTEHWPALYDEYTRTFRELGRTDVRRLREEVR